MQWSAGRRHDGGCSRRRPAARSRARTRSIRAASGTVDAARRERPAARSTATPAVLAFAAAIAPRRDQPRRSEPAAACRRAGLSSSQAGRRGTPRRPPMRLVGSIAGARRSATRRTSRRSGLAPGAWGRSSVAARRCRTGADERERPWERPQVAGSERDRSLALRSCCCGARALRLRGRRRGRRSDRAQLLHLQRAERRAADDRRALLEAVGRRVHDQLRVPADRRRPAARAARPPARRRGQLDRHHGHGRDLDRRVRQRRLGRGVDRRGRDGRHRGRLPERRRDRRASRSKLWAAPIWTNTQLLWYRTDRVTEAAEDLGRDAQAGGRRSRRGRR